MSFLNHKVVLHEDRTDISAVLPNIKICCPTELTILGHRLCRAPRPLKSRITSQQAPVLRSTKGVNGRLDIWTQWEGTAVACWFLLADSDNFYPSVCKVCTALEPWYQLIMYTYQCVSSTATYLLSTDLKCILQLLHASCRLINFSTSVIKKLWLY